MKRFFFSFLFIFLILSLLSESAFAQGKDFQARNLIVNRKIDGRGNIPLWWNGFIYGNYAGTAFDVIRFDYTGSGHYILNLLGDSSPVLTLTKAGNLWVAGGISGSTAIPDSDASNFLTLKWAEDDSADRDLSFKILGANRILEIEGDSKINQDLTTDGSPTFDDLNLADDLDVAGHMALGNLANLGVPYGYVDPQPSYNLVFQLHEQDTATSGWGYGQENYIELNPASESSRSYFGIWESLSIPSANTQNFTAVLDGAYLQTNHAGSGTVSFGRGSKSIVWNNAGGTLTTAIGTEGRVRNDEGAIGTAIGFRSYLSQKVNPGQITDAYAFLSKADSTAGTIDDFYGFYFEDVTGAGTLNNLYGIYLETPTKGGTSNYAIYSVGGNSYLGGNLGLGDTTPTEAKLVIDPGTGTGLALSGNIDQDNQKAVTYTVSADTDFDNSWGIYTTVNTGTGTLGDQGGILLREAAGIYNDVTVATDHSVTDWDMAYAYGIKNVIKVPGKQGQAYGVYNSITDLTGGDYNYAAGVFTDASTGLTMSEYSYLYAIHNFLNPATISNDAVIVGEYQQVYCIGAANGATVYGIGMSIDLIGTLYDVGTGDAVVKGLATSIRTEAADVAYDVYMGTDTYAASTGGQRYGLHIDITDTDVTRRSINVTDSSGVTYHGPDFALRTGGYLNFGTTWGSSGYGIRDNSGTIEIKDSGGSWAAPGGGGLWSQNSGYIYPTTTTNSVNIATGESYMINANEILWINETDYNLVLGKGAGANLGSNSDYNTFLGESTGAATANGDHNVYIGYNAGASATETLANYSVVIGSKAGESGNPQMDVYIGYQAGNDTGQYPNDNIYIGRQSGFSAEGDYNTVVGSQTRTAATASGDGNSLFGWQAGQALTSAQGSVIIGAEAGELVTTGDSNIIIGYEAGDTLTTGYGNIIIGYQADADASNRNYSIAIGFQAQPSADKECVIGSSFDAAELDEIYLGQGVTDVNPQGVTIHATGGSGSDNAGGHLIISGGKGTGNATPGYVIFKTADKGASGPTLQGLKESGRFTETEFVVKLEQVYTPSSAQLINDAGDTILANATIVKLNPNADYTLTSTPTILDGSEGQILKITCPDGESNYVAVQDEGTLSGSNIQLSGVTSRSVSGNDYLELTFNGTYWCETGYNDN